MTDELSKTAQGLLATVLEQRIELNRLNALVSELLEDRRELTKRIARLKRNQSELFQHQHN